MASPVRAYPERASPERAAPAPAPALAPALAPAPALALAMAPAPAGDLAGRPALLSTAGLRRALRAEFCFLRSMLAAAPLGPRRLLGPAVSHQPPAVIQYCQKKPLLHSCYHIIFLLCLLICIFCYSLSSGSVTWMTKFPLHHTRLFTFHRANRPSYYVHPKQRTKLKEMNETSAPSTTLPTVAPTGAQYHHAYPRNYRFIMDNTEACEAVTPFLVLLVPVEPNNVAARDAIRQTWGNRTVVQGEVVITLFMLGLSKRDDDGQQREKLNQENLQHHDLIQSDFMDTYLNLTIKTMVIMDWLATRCPTAAYAMKIDSDMFLNIDNLVIMLQKPGIPKINYLTGMLMWDRPVVRSKDSKWYVPEEMYPDPQYPTYTLGMGYVFSNDLPEKFVEVSKSIKPFNIEDAYIGMCMKKLGLTPTSPPDPSQFKAYNTRYDRCEFSQIITYILGSSQELINYWTELKKPGPLC